MKYLIVLAMVLLWGASGILMAKNQPTPIATDDPGISNEDDDVEVSVTPTATETPIVRSSVISKEEKPYSQKVDPYGDYAMTPLPTMPYVPMGHNYLTPIGPPTATPFIPAQTSPTPTSHKKKKKAKPTPTPSVVPSASVSAK